MNSDTDQFSRREKEVTVLLLQGKSNKQIALALGITASTVEYHLKNVYKKLQVNSRTEAVLLLGKSTGENAASESGKSTVEGLEESSENGFQPDSTWRISVNKKFVMIGAGLITIALVIVLVFVKFPAKSTAGVPTIGSPLPDLAITSAYVTRIDPDGRCLPYYGFSVTVVNMGNAPASEVMLGTKSGQQVMIGTLNPQETFSMPFVATSMGGDYTVIADPQNTIVESNEDNNSATFYDATATPPASCDPIKDGGTPTPTR